MERSHTVESKYEQSEVQQVVKDSFGSKRLIDRMECFDVIVCLEDGYDSEVNDHDYDYESQVSENAYILYKTIEEHDNY